MMNPESPPLLSQMKPIVWFLGFGVGCAAGLAVAVAIFAIFSGAPTQSAVIPLGIAAAHSAIVILLWIQRHKVRVRTAIMISMLASALLTFFLAWTNGRMATPFYGLAFMHVLLAFFHPSISWTAQTTAPPSP